MSNNEIEKVKQDLKDSEIRAFRISKASANAEYEKTSLDSKSEVKSLNSEITALKNLNELLRNELQRVLQLTN